MEHTYKWHRELDLAARPTFGALHDDALERAMNFFGAVDPDSISIVVDVQENQASSFLLVDVTMFYEDVYDTEDNENDTFRQFDTMADIEPPF